MAELRQYTPEMIEIHVKDIDIGYSIEIYSALEPPDSDHRIICSFGIEKAKMNGETIEIWIKSWLTMMSNLGLGSMTLNQIAAQTVFENKQHA